MQIQSMKCRVCSCLDYSRPGRTGRAVTRPMQLAKQHPIVAAAAADVHLFLGRIWPVRPSVLYLCMLLCIYVARCEYLIATAHHPTDAFKCMAALQKQIDAEMRKNRNSK